MKIAITGSIGSGKSTVSNYLREKGYEVFDCDKYNAYLLDNNKTVFNKIKKTFPEAIDDDKLNKKKLASIIFNNINDKRKLEDILHPLIIKEMLKRSKDNDIFFAEVPLLFETNLEANFDHNLLVVSDYDVTLKRLIKRGLNKEEAIIRLNNQMAVENKILRAEEIIYNNGNLNKLFKEVDKWLKKYVR